MAGAAVGRALERQGRAASGVAALERAGIRLALPDFVLFVALLTLGLGVTGTLLAGPLLGGLLALAGPLGAKLVLGLKTGRRQAAFVDQLDDSLQLMASSLRAGHSLLRAVDSVAQEAAAPTSEEFARIVNETRVGRDLNAIRRQVKALSAEGRLSAVILMALPFAVSGFIWMTNPGYLSVFTESLVGCGMLATVVVLLLLGGLWLTKLVRIKL